MKRAVGKEWARAIVLSPEMFITLVLLGLVGWFPQWFERLGAGFREAEPSLAWTIISLPAGMALLTYKLTRRLTHPEGRRDDLVRWPDYWRLVVRIKLALWISVLAVVLMAASWVVLRLGSPVLGGWVAVYAAILGGVSLFSVALAPFELEAILDGAEE